MNRHNVLGNEMQTYVADIPSPKNKQEYVFSRYITYVLHSPIYIYVEQIQ